MGFLEAIVLGIVQGLTEFLPISSTGHIRIIPALVGWPDPGAAFTAVIQLGTLLAVLIFFRKELWAALTAWAKSLTDAEARKTPDAKIGWGIFVGTIPIVVAGVLFKDAIETQLRSLYVIAVTLIVMGIVMGVTDRIGAKKRSEREATVLDGLWVGIAQAIALIPGASRSGSTISGALLCGFDRATAARYSFLLSVPSVFAAAVFEVWGSRAHLAEAGLAAVIWANVAAFVVGYASIAFLIRWLQSRSLMPFIVYRVVLGLIIFGLVYWNVVPANAGLPTEDALAASLTR